MTNLTYSLLVGHFLLIMEYFSRSYNGYDDEDDENAYIYHDHNYTEDIQLFSCKCIVKTHINNVFT